MAATSRSRQPPSSPATPAPAAVPDPNPLLQIFEQMQRIGLQSLQEMAGDARTEADEVRQAPTLPAVQAVQAEFAAAEWARLAQLGERMFASLLDAQAAWVRGVEAWTAGLLGRGLAGQTPAAAGIAAMFGPAVGPAGWLAAAQAPWFEVMHAWQGALTNDLQAERASDAG